MSGRPARGGEELLRTGQQLSLRGHVSRHPGGRCSSNAEDGVLDYSSFSSLLFLRKIYLRISSYVCVHVSVWARMQVSAVTGEDQKGASRYPGTGIASGCKPPEVGVNLHPLL